MDLQEKNFSSDDGQIEKNGSEKTVASPPLSKE